MRPISRDVRRSTEVNRDLLYEPDEHLKRDAEFPLCADCRAATPLTPAQTSQRILESRFPRRLLHKPLALA